MIKPFSTLIFRGGSWVEAHGKFQRGDVHENGRVFFGTEDGKPLWFELFHFLRRAESHLAAKRRYFEKNAEIVRSKDREVAKVRRRELAKDPKKKAKYLEYLAKYRQDNSVALEQKASVYRERNKEKLSASRKKRYYRNPVKYLVSSALSVQKGKENKEYAEKIRLRQRVFYKNNRKRYAAKYKSRIKTDPLFALSTTARSSVQSAFRRNGFKKSSRTAALIGCSWEKLREHLEGLFTDGMAWENRGQAGWHIDHIIPLASATTADEVIALCHYTNLQPLWAIDNIRKSDKMPCHIRGRLLKLKRVQP